MVCIMDKMTLSSPADAQDVAVASSTCIRPQHRQAYDHTISFEEYYYYAQKTREEEQHLEAPKTDWAELLFMKKKDNKQPDAAAVAPSTVDDAGRLQITDEEWTNASRMMRTASWGACFYLITTDILGPYGVGFALGTLGWGPGVAFYTIFGFFAGYSGYLIWRVYLGVDSYEYPARNYGDLGFRTWGRAARHVTNILQGLALILLTGQVTLQYGENISQTSRFRLCYVVCPVLFICAGFFLTQIRTLRNYGWVATFAVFINLLTIWMNMGVMAHSPPNFAIATLGSAGSSVDRSSITPDKNGNYPPIRHYGNLPPNGLVGSINGLMSGVLAYAGAQLFVEFLAEMRRPRDFIKAMWGAQFFIYTVYLVYGCYVYHFQGQYSFNPAYMGVSPYGWQVVGNMLTLVGALISAGLYSNIGIKVVYNNIFLDILGFPTLSTRTGKIIYACIVPVWWAIAFIIAAAIPDFFGLVSVVSASTLLPMTYVMPGFFALGFDVQKNAIRPERGEGFDPTTGRVVRYDGTVRRLVRGFFSGGILQVCTNIWHVLYFLASLATSGLGLYAAIIGWLSLVLSFCSIDGHC